MGKEIPAPSSARRRGAACPPAPAHVLSVDVEDYFQVEAFADRVPRSSWSGWPSRVADNTRRLLDLFDAHGARATFFFVGWVADRHPELVREAVARGHEPACHSYWHRTVYSMTPEAFRADTRRAKDAIEQAGGRAVAGYRAPSWSITGGCLWALDVLAEEGFVYDSSIYPIHHDLYGVPGAERFAHLRACAGGRLLQEHPPATVRLPGLNLPAAGGGYLRIFPWWYTRLALSLIERRERRRAVVYLHPWEIDPAQPRITGRLKSRLRHYTNLGRMQGRLERLLKARRFLRFADVLHETMPQADPADVSEPQGGGIPRLERTP